MKPYLVVAELSLGSLSYRARKQTETAQSVLIGQLVVVAEKMSHFPFTSLPGKNVAKYTSLSQTKLKWPPSIENKDLQNLILLTVF